MFGLTIDFSGCSRDSQLWALLSILDLSLVSVEVNGVRSKPLILSRSICQGCPLSPMLYILALEPVLHGITLPGSNTLARYSAYDDDVNAFIKNNAEIDEIGKEISRYEEVTGTRINRDKSMGLWLGAWKGVSFAGPFT